MVDADVDVSIPEDVTGSDEEMALEAFFALEEKDHEYEFRCSVENADDVELDLD